MSACHTYPTKADAISGFCDEFPDFCEVSDSGIESVPSDVEKSILLDTLSTNDRNDCDGGFDFDLACPTACGTPQTTVSATYRVVADAFGGGEECPYYDGFKMERTCPATPACPVDCVGSWTSPPCPTACGTPASTRNQTWVMTTPAQFGGSCDTGTAPTYSCPATGSCSVTLKYINAVFKEWGQFICDYSTCGNMVTPKTMPQTTSLKRTTTINPQQYDPIDWAYSTDRGNGGCSQTPINFYWSKKGGELVRDVNFVLRWFSDKYSAGNITPKKYRIWSKRYDSRTVWTLVGDFTTNLDTIVETNWDIGIPSYEYRMEVYEWHPGKNYGCYYYIDRDNSYVYHKDAYYDVALSGYTGNFTVTEISVSTNNMSIRYDDVEYIQSYELRGITPENEDVLIYDYDNMNVYYLYSGVHVQSSAISSSTTVKNVYVRLKIGRSTGRGDYIGETHGLSITVGGKQI